jgi:DNA-binding response OmpR family regulator
VLAARPIPLLIIDEHLSDMRGDELAAAAKGTSPATSVLMITADVELDAEASWANVDRCLIKPFPIRDLLAAVSTLLPSTAPVR